MDFLDGLVFHVGFSFYRTYDKKKKQLERHNDQLGRLEVQATDRDENKTIALGTSKLNYLDPRISVAWLVDFCFLPTMYISWVLF